MKINRYRLEKNEEFIQDTFSQVITFLSENLTAINYAEISSSFLNQISSISASLIPFLEHDDANRALMGSNMQRQAVPIMNPHAPIVGTGLEAQVAKDSRTQLVAKANGVVEFVDANEIRIKYEMSEDDILSSFIGDTETYNITKFRRTNQNMTVNLRPIVVKGDKVVEGQVLSEGYGTQGGELALGRNLKVAFMPPLILKAPIF